ncbi:MULTISPECIES: protein YgfX [Tatumella]|uniref:protein YgfX n=1 Tax=Tatumella TaxID=82986 RepID=UPI00047053DB|nr:MULTISPECIES: protein YgfX [Tatumella]
MNVTSNAARWQSELVPSRLACRIQCSVQALIVLAVVFTPWTWGGGILKLMALCLVWREGQLARRRFRERCGVLEVDAQGRWRWQQQSWRTRGNPGWLPFAVLLSLENAAGQRLRFWLMQDAMPAQDWRALRMHWFYCRSYSR